MPTSCFNVELVKVANCLMIADRHGTDFTALRLANRTPDGAGESTKYLYAIAAELECMPVEPACWSWRKLNGSTSAYFDMTPTALLREAQEPIANES